MGTNLASPPNVLIAYKGYSQVFCRVTLLVQEVQLPALPTPRRVRGVRAFKARFWRGPAATVLQEQLFPRAAAVREGLWHWRA